ATKIMIIRHGEKPHKRDGIHGVTPAGRSDKDELSIRGWQRSGALVRFFDPADGRFRNACLAKPDAVFAAAPSNRIRSLRSQHTVETVARSVGVRVNVRHSKGDEDRLVKDILARGTVVLLAWEHHAIIEIANLILGTSKRSPQKWPDSRF